MPVGLASHLSDVVTHLSQQHLTSFSTIASPPGPSNDLHLHPASPSSPSWPPPVNPKSHRTLLREAIRNAPLYHRKRDLLHRSGFGIPGLALDDRLIGQLASEGMFLAKKSFNNPEKVYKHNLQVTVAEQTPGIVSSNLWDEKGVFNRNFICPEGDGHPKPVETNLVLGAEDKRPRLDFNYPVDNVHVHMVDKVNGKVHWDVIMQRDMASASTQAMIKRLAKKMAGMEEHWFKVAGRGGILDAQKDDYIGGTQQEFLSICPPKDDPPHWWEQWGFGWGWFRGFFAGLFDSVPAVEISRGKLGLSARG